MGDIPVQDPRAGMREVHAEVLAAVERVIEGGHFILGPEVEAFEGEFAEFIGTGHAIGVGNGTDALRLALVAVGVEPGDEVITVSWTAGATVAAIAGMGAIPVLVDVEDDYLTLDPALLDAAWSERARAVVPVHIYGQSADLDAIQAWCDLRGIPLVEDVAQGHAGEHAGRRLGSVGAAASFSFYPTKNLGALGDGGLVMVQDDAAADRVRALRQYGWRQRNWSEELGINSRLDEVQAGILRVGLARLAGDLERRERIADRYRANLVGTHVRLVPERSGCRHAHHLFVMRTADRESIIHGLAERGVGSSIHYPVPVHRQPAYEAVSRIPGSLAVTDRLSAEVLSLPMYPSLTDAEVDRVCESLVEAIETS
jgi:dTDP-4-amino-4,6-dideoxygalactose transaminase